MWSGLSLGVTPAMTAMLSPLWGRLADRFGRKIMVERSLVSFVVVMSAMAFVTRPWHVFALRVVQGMFAGYGALSLTMAADSAPPGKMAAGDRHGADGAAARSGDRPGRSAARSRRSSGCAGRSSSPAAFYLIALVVVFLMYDERDAPAHAETARAGARTVTFRNVLAFENFLLMAVVIFGLQFVDRSFGPVLPLYVGELGIGAGAHPARLGPAVLDCRRRRRDRASLLRRAAAPLDRGAADCRLRRGRRGRHARRIWSRTTCSGCSWPRRSSASRSASGRRRPIRPRRR